MKSAEPKKKKRNTNLGDPAGLADMVGAIVDPHIVLRGELGIKFHVLKGQKKEERRKEGKEEKKKR